MGDPLVYCIETGQTGGLLESVDEHQDVVNSNTNDDKEGDHVEKTNRVNVWERVWGNNITSNAQLAMG